MCLTLYKNFKSININLIGVASLGLGFLVLTPTVKNASGPSPSYTKFRITSVLSSTI